MENEIGGYSGDILYKRDILFPSPGNSNKRTWERRAYVDKSINRKNGKSKFKKLIEKSGEFSSKYDRKLVESIL